MLTMTLTFNTAEEALAALKKLEGTAADPVVKKSVQKAEAAATPRTVEEALAAVPETKGEPSARTEEEAKKFFREVLAKAFLGLGALEDGEAKQRKVVDHFEVAKLSNLDPSKYDEAVAYIKGLAK